MTESLLALSDWRDANTPDVQLWVTEYGYDSNSGSPYGAPTIGPYDSEQVQGMWILRSILSFAAAKVQRAHQFMWVDINSSPNDNGAYGTSGLVTDKYQPKKSYYYFVCMYRTLKDYYFVKRDCTLNNGNVCVQQFISMDGTSNGYVVWAPTSTAQVINGYSVTVKGTKSAKLYTPTVGNPDCSTSDLTVNNGAVTVNVEELPQFIINT